MQQELLSTAEGDLSAAEKSLLREEAYGVKANGHVRTFPAKIGLTQRVKLAVHLVGRLHPASAVDYNSPGWQQLLSALSVRDRLTHPKDKSAMSVRDDELTAAVEGGLWFLKNVRDVLRKGISGYGDRIRNMRELARVLMSAEWATPRQVGISSFLEVFKNEASSPDQP